MMAFNMGAVGRGEYQTEQQAPVDTQDYQSKAAFENFLREQGDTAYVDQYVQEHPDQFLTPAQLYKLEQVGPEAFWGGANDSTGASGNTAGGFDNLIPKDNNGSPFVEKYYDENGWLIATYADGSKKYIIHDASKSQTGTGKNALYKATDGKTFTDQQTYLLYQQNLDTKKQNRQSAYDLLYNEFKSYGLESLVADIKGLIEKDVPDSQFTLELRNSPKYQARFSANADRVNKGLRALNEATYLQLEDQYQNLMRNYGLPDTYWKRGDLGIQEGFTKLIANDVSPTELENRLQLAKDQIEKGPKEYMDAIKAFYPEINKSDLMAYVLDPTNALKSIQSKVSAAQIGGEYLRAGLLKPEEASAYAGRAKEGLADMGKRANMSKLDTVDISVGAYSKSAGDEPTKTSGIKIRGTGAATKGVMARGPMA